MDYNQFFNTQGVSTELTSKVFKPGVNEVAFIGVEFKSAKKDGTGSPVIVVNFEDQVTGAAMDKKIWEVKPEVAANSGLVGRPMLNNRTIKMGDKEVKYLKDQIITSEMAILMAYDDFRIEIAQLCHSLNPELSVAGANYASLAQDLVAKTKPYIGTTVKVACEYRGQYLEIRRRTPYMSSKNDKRLHGLTLKLTKEEVAPTSNEDLDKSDDLPF